MIATIKAVVSRALVRVGWRHGGALVLEILDWSLEGYYAGQPQSTLRGAQEAGTALRADYRLESARLRRA